MEGMGRERGWNLPFMVRLVDVFIDVLVMQEAVDPVYAGVGEQNEGHNAPKDSDVTCKNIKHEVIYRMKRLLSRYIKQRHNYIL